jgi:hypothetical protein
MLVCLSQDSKLLVVVDDATVLESGKTRSDAVSRPWHSSLSSADPSSSFRPPSRCHSRLTFAVQMHNTFREKIHVLESMKSGWTSPWSLY